MHHPDCAPISVAEQRILDGMAAAVRVKHESWRTGRTYGWAVVAYHRWLQRHPGLRGAPSEEKLCAYLTACAPQIAAKTQNQRLCAIVRYYAQVLQKPLGKLPPWVYAKVPQRLPTWLNHDEIRRLLGVLTGTPALMAKLTYGAGLRLMEITRLRVQDVDFSTRMIAVRGGKGGKDRMVPLPTSLAPELARHLERVHVLWEADRARGTPPVELPDTLARKLPNAGRDWAWFWIFPGRDLSRDLASGIIRRHHVTRNCLQKAIGYASRRAAIPKRVTVHTLRHSFATHQLMRGVHVKQLQELLGHTSLETTQIYLHCLPSAVHTAGSPLDDLATNTVVEFPRAARAV